MASTVGRWNPAWGPEPQWQGPAKEQPPSKPKPKQPRLRWYVVNCSCRPGEYLVRHPGMPDYTCARCGAPMHAEPRATSVQPGERYGRLVVMEVIRRGKRGSGARCRCDCGVLKIVAAHHLRDGSTKSCGCLSKTPAASHPWRQSYKAEP